MSQMYNDEQKQKFLEEIKDDNTIYKTTSMLFEKAHKYEHSYGKDISDFNKDQLLDFLSSLNVNSNTLRYYRALLLKYVDHCVNKNWAKENQLKLLTAEDIKNLNDNIKQDDYYDANFIYKLVTLSDGGVSGMHLKNIQDMLMIYLIFLGVTGTKLNVLRHIKYEHVDFTNKILNISAVDSDFFDIKVDDLCLYLIKASRTESVYHNYDSDEYFRLKESDYLIRRKEDLHDESVNDEPVSTSTLHKRLKSIREYLGIASAFSSSKIEHAGLVFFGKKVIEKESLNVSIRNPLLNEFVFNRYRIKSDIAKYKKLSLIKEEISNNTGVLS